MGVRAARAPVRAASLVADLSSPSPAVRYGAGKTLIQIAETEPHRLYSHFDVFVNLLDSEHRILRWNAARILAGLAAADTEDRIEGILDKYMAVVPGPEMIAAGTAIQGAARIASAKPALADRLARAILGVRTAVYKTPECRNIAIGHAIKALDGFFGSIVEQEPVLAFVSAQRANSRAATRKKAEAFLRKHARTSARLNC